MKSFTVRRLSIKESVLNMPAEGIFWIINNEFVAFDNPVTTDNTSFTTIEHKKIWHEISSRYKVNDHIVDYNYFPRGRVMVNAIKDINGKFTHYEAYIYIDKCINNEETLENVIYTFRLNKSNCKIKYIGTDGGITDNHYTCHFCK